MPSAPYPLARIVTVLINAVIWWLLLLVSTWIFAGGGNHAGFVSPRAMANIAALTLLLVPFFATHGVLIGMHDALQRGRIVPPALSEDPEARPVSVWRSALLNALRLGVVAAIAGYVLASRLPAETITPGAFAWKLACAGMLSSIVSAWLASGAPLLHELRVPAARRTFGGDKASYLKWRHGVPHGVVNTLINAAVAYALIPGTITAATKVAGKIVVGDTLITFCLLLGILVPGVSNHARVDAALGIMPPSAADGPKLAIADAALTPFFAGVGLTLLMALFFKLTPVRFDADAWAVYRALAFGGYSAWLATRVAASNAGATAR